MKLRPKFLLALLPILVGITFFSYVVVAVIFWRQIRKATLVLCDRDGKIMAVQGPANASGTVAQQWLNEALNTPEERKYWLVDGHLYEVSLQPTYFGVPSNGHAPGLLGLGYEIDSQVAAEIGKIAASQVVFEHDGEIIASSFLRQDANPLRTLPQGGTHFLFTTVDLDTSPPVVRLVVFKSVDQADQFISFISTILAAIGLSAIVTGTILIVTITHRFTKPLDSLLAGVLALQHQEFDYPLDSSRNDEFSTLTSAFERMRSGLLKAQEKLVDSARLATMGTMASSISHDLRHRLTAVLANAEFLSSERLPSSRRQELYQEVDNAIRGMTDLLESMVELSRTSESLQVDVVCLNDILTKAIVATKSHPRFRQVPMDVDCDEDIYGWYDARKLERAFFNVILNACEAIPKDNGQIEIQVRQVAERVYIRVTDNGPGVPARIQDKLFQPFVSAGKQNGSGLGLAIVQKCCLDHHGSVDLEVSSPGRTTFRITLPVEPRNTKNGKWSVLTGAVHGS